MGRLIDADVLLARISLNYNNHQNITAGAMKDIINTTPTAYNVEKVVAEINGMEVVLSIDCISADNLKFTNKILRLVKDGAIERIRKGGVE